MPSPRDIELSLVIPAYNESEIILRNIGELEQWMTANLAHVDYEIIVVDDGSTDGMGRRLDERAVTDKHLRVAHHKRNMGRGRGIRTGFEASRAQYVICLDADLSYAPEHIARLLTPLVADEADITLASAYHPDGSVQNVPFTRALMSRWANFLLSRGLKSKLHTVTCIVRGFSRKAIDQLELINDGKDLHLEIIQKSELFGLRLKEVPGHLNWRDRDRKTKKPQGRFINRIPFLSMSGTIASHLIYSYVLRPGAMLQIPVISLMFVTLISAAVLAWAWLERLFGPGTLGLNKIYTTLRETLLQGQLTLLVMVSSLLVSAIFLAFYFASQQSKRYHDEIYVLLSRVNARLKELERAEKD